MYMYPNKPFSIYMFIIITGISQQQLTLYNEEDIKTR